MDLCILRLYFLSKVNYAYNLVKLKWGGGDFFKYTSEKCRHTKTLQVIFLNLFGSIFFIISHNETLACTDDDSMADVSEKTFQTKHRTININLYR